MPGVRGLRDRILIELSTTFEDFRDVFTALKDGGLLLNFFP